MILCVCLSPALDVTYRVDALTIGATHRVVATTSRAGGKGVNVARVLRLLGDDVHLLAPVGSATGAELASALDAADVPCTLVPDAAATRRTTTVVADDGSATSFSESAWLTCWPELAAQAAALLRKARVLVISGSQPGGAPDDAIATLVGLAHANGVPSVVDTSGPALLSAVAARPTLVKPNADELEHLRQPEDPADLAGVVASLSDRHGTGVVASRGPEGLIASVGGDTWTVIPGDEVSGNPTGAGDALVAGLARLLASSSNAPDASVDWAGGLAEAVAVSMSAVEAPAAGEVDPARVPMHRAGVQVLQGAGR